MAERQETSVMVSIQEILRDAQNREEQEKVEAERRAREDEQRRLDDMRRKQEDEEARMRADEADRQRRAFEEQRRQAEIQAVQEGAIQRARMEAEAQARLQEMTARQEHERQLHALSHDKHKKRLVGMLVGLGVLLVVGGGGLGYWAYQSHNAALAAQAQARELQGQIDDEQNKQKKLQADLEAAKQSGNDNQVQELQAQLMAEQAKLQSLQTSQKKVGFAGGGGGGGGGVKAGGGGGGGGKACSCAPGDPLCSCP
jgi:colicin import membrane protein